MESCVLYILKKGTENQVRRDERRGKGELMFKSVLGRNVCKQLLGAKQSCVFMSALVD